MRNLRRRVGRRRDPVRDLVASRVSPRRLFGRHLTPEERRLALRIAAVFAIPMALIMVIPLIAAFLFYRDIVNDRIAVNREAIARVEEERIERTRVLNDFVFRLCVENEVRDVVIAEQLEAAKRRVFATLPPGPVRADQIETLNEGIFALEPLNEQDCTPPAAQQPSGGTP